MEAVIKISAEEFNQNLFNQLQKLIKNYKNGSITISLKGKAILDSAGESPEQYEERLLKSISELDNGMGVSFTMESLETFLKNSPNE